VALLIAIADAMGRRLSQSAAQLMVESIPDVDDDVLMAAGKRMIKESDRFSFPLFLQLIDETVATKPFEAAPSNDPDGVMSRIRRQLDIPDAEEDEE
jgi:hypothetical protein